MEARTIISAAVALHGIIHLTGFMKEWQLGPTGNFSGRTITQFSKRILRCIGLLWLLVCLVLFVAAAMCYLHEEGYWIAMGVGIIVSQTLIILYWPDAKWGTVVNVIFLVITVFVLGQVQFDHKVERDIENLGAASEQDFEAITEDRVLLLPYPVERWLGRSGLVRRPVPRGVHMFQRGTLRTAPKNKWLLFQAEQYFSVSPPGFVWRATIHQTNLLSCMAATNMKMGTVT